MLVDLVADLLAWAASRSEWPWLAFLGSMAAVWLTILAVRGVVLRAVDRRHDRDIGGR